MKFRILPLIFAVPLLLAGVAGAGDFRTWSPEIQALLRAGNIVELPHRPGENPSGIDRRFVTMGKLMKATREELWAITIDKDNTEKFLDGVLESRILSQTGNEIILEQRTEAGGTGGSYLYTLKYTLTPMKVALFTYVKGEIRNVEGGWWILEGPDAEHKLVIYSIHIDPGRFAPQFVVRRGIRKTVPNTLLNTEREVLRRRNALR